MSRKPRTVLPYPPDALLLNWEQRISPAISSGVHAYAHALRQHPAVRECVPGYASLLVRYARPKITAYDLREFIFALNPLTEETGGILHEIPVCYADDFAPDLPTVAAAIALSPEEIIRLHTDVEYLVYQVGFRPGFAFLGQTDARLEIPRRTSPRRRVPAGTVGLAGRQTGIYPSESPGGWQLIGRCPWPLLRAGKDFCRFQAGDRVRFHSVSATEFAQLQKTSAPWPVR
ncbi:MAG: 5-oxoprolinase subunit PxpB [Bacteroidota bacterium]